MDVPHDLLIEVMREEHRRTVSRNMFDPDWPPARRVEMTRRRTALRRRLSDVLRAVADRLEPSGTRSHGGQLVVMPYAEDGAKTAC
jgi:hypothetical protein